MNKKTYSIQQVSDLTELSKQLIRKWEDRYQIIQPERLDNGYRVYTEDEVQILLKLKQSINNGMTIKQAVAHYEANKNTPEENPVHYFNKALIQAGTEGNEHKIFHLLEQAHHKFGVEKLISDIIVPFLHKIGELWCEKAWGEYQEAISSQTVRDFLSYTRRHFFIREDAPLVLGSCLPGERHEIPIQILLIHCMLRGYRTLMLGPSPAPTAIQSTIALKKPSIVLLTASTDIVFTDFAQSVQTLEKLAQAHQQIAFYIGGAGTEIYYEQFQLSALKFAKSIDDILPLEPI